MPIRDATFGATGAGGRPVPEDYLKVADVSPSGSDHSTVASAITDVNVGLSATQHGLVRLFVEEITEDFTVPDFVHVVGQASAGTIIKGSVAAGTDIITLEAAGSLENVRIEPQANKASAIKLVTGGGTAGDVRVIHNVIITDQLGAFVLTEAIRYEANIAAASILLVDVNLNVKSGIGINFLSTAVGTIVLLNGLFTSDSGKVFLIDAAKIEQYGGAATTTTGSIDVNVSGGWVIAGGVRFDESKVNNPSNIAKVAPSMQFSYDNTASGLTAVDVQGALDELDTSVDLNNAHRTSDGSDHTFIDQDVTASATPEFAGAGIGVVTPNASALVELASTTKGFLLMRMTTVQRDAIASPIAGLEIYNTTTNKLEAFDGTNWIAHFQTTPVFWIATGALAAVISIDGFRAAPVDLSIVKVFITRRLAGTSGSTIVDINKAASGGSPTTLYTTQANRPTVTAAAGNNLAIEATLPDIVDVDAGDFVNIDIDQVEAGSGPGAPQDLELAIGVIPR